MRVKSKVAESGWPWLLAIRPKTLTAALAPVLVGTALGAKEVGSIDWVIAFFALLAALMIQIATNLINDLLDFKKGADNAERLGPTRVTQMGLLRPQQVLSGAFSALLLSALFAIPLLVKGGVPMVLLLISSMLLSYLYTGGPYPLAYYGLGEPFVLLYFGFFGTAAAAYLQTLRFSSAALIAGGQIGFLATGLLAINNLRDIVGDRKAGKRTLIARFGPLFGRIEIAVCLFLPFVLGFFWLQEGRVVAALLPLVLLPLGWKLFKAVWQTEPSRSYNGFLAKMARLHLLFSLLLVIGLF